VAVRGSTIETAAGTHGERVSKSDFSGTCRCLLLLALQAAKHTSRQATRQGNRHIREAAALPTHAPVVAKVGVAEGSERRVAQECTPRHRLLGVNHPTVAAVPSSAGICLCLTFLLGCVRGAAGAQ
jgi:hypothetical protein